MGLIKSKQTAQQKEIVPQQPPLPPSTQSFPPIHILIVGLHSGKTTLLYEYGDMKRCTYLKYGVEFIYKSITVSGRQGKIFVWDTCNTSLASVYPLNRYRNVKGAVVLFDLSYRQSFVDIDISIDLVKNRTTPNTVLFLVGNKCDKEKERQVSFEEGADKALKYGIPYAEVSAETGFNVVEIFQSIAEMIVSIMFNSV